MTWQSEEREESEETRMDKFASGQYFIVLSRVQGHL